MMQGKTDSLIINIILRNRQRMDKTEIFIKDMECIEKSVGDCTKVYGKSVMITGATGMLAHYCVCFFMYLNKKYNADIKVIALVKNNKKAEEMFRSYLDSEMFEILVQDISKSIDYGEKVDFIIHAAGYSSPYHIKNNPVGIIEANIVGTINILNFAMKGNISNILYTSTREIYGELKEKETINEGDMGVLDPLDMRSCYPESKRMGEQIFESFYRQYSIPFKIVRIAHVYGPGMAICDGRVMSDFIGDVVNGRNIVLKSDGLADRAFCYLTDAVAAMIIVLLKGNNGEAYNISNEEEPVIIRELAEKLAKMLPNISLEYIENKDKSGYCAYKRTGLGTDKLRKLGWKPMISLDDGLVRTVSSFQMGGK